MARPPPGVRSLTGISNVTEPSAATRPTRWASRAAKAVRRLLLVPPRERARASHSSASTKIVAVGIVISSSALSSGAGAPVGGLVGAATPRRAIRAAAMRARPISGRSRALWRASSRSARHRGRDLAAGQLIGSRRPLAASANAAHSPTPSVRQCEMTKLTPAPPSVNGSTAKCHSGPCSASRAVVLACSLSQASNSLRGSGFSTISRSD